MTETAPSTTTAHRLPLLTGVARSTVERRDLTYFAVATLATWAHTIDELRIGEYIAVPFGVTNIALVAAWPRLRPAWRAAVSILFGLFWTLAVIPYHVVPLFEGAVTGQNISGLFRVVGGVAMVILGIAIVRRQRRAASPPMI